MPIIDFPKGPMATPEAYPIDQPEEPDIGVADIATNVVKIATKRQINVTALCVPIAEVLCSSYTTTVK